MFNARLEKFHLQVVWVCSLACILIGLIGLIGWGFNLPSLLRVIPNSSPISFNAVISFLCSGPMMLYLCSHFQTTTLLPRLFGLFLLLYNLTIFIQIEIGSAFQIDTFVAHYLFSNPLKQSSAIASLGALIFTGTAFLLLPTKRFYKWNVFIYLLTSVFVILIGSLGFLSFFVPIQATFSIFQKSTPITFLAATGFHFLGIGLISMASYVMFRQRLFIHGLYPIITFIGLFIFTTLVTYGFYADSVHTENLVSRSSDLWNRPFVFVLEISGITISIAAGLLVHFIERLRLRAEQLYESDEKFRFFVFATNDWIWEIDLAGNITFSNDSVKAIFDDPDFDPTKANYFDLMTAEEQGKARKEFQDLVAKRQGWSLTKRRWKNKTGIDVWLESCANPVLDSAGKLIKYRGAEHDITQQIATDKLKNEFIAMVSHELRTPLTSISGAIALLGQIVDSSTDKGKQLIAIAKSNCERLTHIVSDILDIEKIEAGKITLNIEPINVKKLIEEVISDNMVYARKWGKELVFEGCDDELTIRADNLRVKQVFSNLISNAAKFSYPNSQITIAVYSNHNSVSFSVKDSGPGIPEEIRAHLFEKFVRAPTTDKSGVTGTGLGLNITRSYIALLGGKISLVTKKNVGTTFTFDLPKYDERSNP